MAKTLEQIQGELKQAGFSQEFDKFLIENYGLSLPQAIVNHSLREEKLSISDFSDLDFGVDTKGLLAISRSWDFGIKTRIGVVNLKLRDGNKPLRACQGIAEIPSGIKNVKLVVDNRDTVSLVKVESNVKDFDKWPAVAMAVVKFLAKAKGLKVKAVVKADTKPEVVQPEVVASE